LDEREEKGIYLGFRREGIRKLMGIKEGELELHLEGGGIFFIVRQGREHGGVSGQGQKKDAILCGSKTILP